MSTSEGKCVLVEVGALISWCIYSYRIVMLLVPYMWASMTFLPVIAPPQCLREPLPPSLECNDMLGSLNNCGDMQVQWLAHRTSDLKVGGSRPVPDIVLFP